MPLSDADSNTDLHADSNAAGPSAEANASSRDLLGPDQPGRGLAVLAEALYLGNLLLAPGLCFVLLLWLWLAKGRTAPPLARQHLRQATFVSLWGGLLIVVLSALLLALGGLHGASTWVAVILYFTCIHSTLVLFGVFALTKAQAGQVWRYPLIGPAIERMP